MLLVNAICSVTVYYVAEKQLSRHIYFSMAKLIYVCVAVYDLCWWYVCWL